MGVDLSLNDFSLVDAVPSSGKDHGACNASKIMRR